MKDQIKELEEEFNSFEQPIAELKRTGLFPGTWSKTKVVQDLSTTVFVFNIMGSHAAKK